MEAIEKSHTEVPASTPPRRRGGLDVERRRSRERPDHDGHQFVARAALLARRGMLPYRDYPYFHTPYLVFVYAGLYRLTGHLLGPHCPARPDDPGLSGFEVEPFAR